MRPVALGDLKSGLLCYKRVGKKFFGPFLVNREKRDISAETLVQTSYVKVNSRISYEREFEEGIGGGDTEVVLKLDSIETPRSQVVYIEDDLWEELFGHESRPLRRGNKRKGTLPRRTVVRRHKSPNK